MSNIFTRAKSLWKRPEHKNKSWQQMVKFASGTHKSSQSKKTAMPVKKKRKAVARVTHHPAKKRRVSGVRTTTKRTTVKRKSVGAILDRNIGYMAAGMFLESVVSKTLINPLMARIPSGLQMFTGPALAIAGYQASTHFKHPLARGLALGVMKTNVDKTVTVVLAKFGHQQSQKEVNATIGDATYVDLPMPNLGEIRQYLGSIQQNVGEAGTMRSNMQNVGADAQNNLFNTYSEPYVPIGWDAGR